MADIPCSVVRHRVSLAGRVIALAAQAGNSPATPPAKAPPLSGAALGKVLAARWSVLRGPNRRQVTASASDGARRYNAHVRNDGKYFFFDLPAGDYVLNGSDEHGNPVVAKSVSIPPAAPGKLPLMDVDLLASAGEPPAQPAKRARR